MLARKLLVVVTCGWAVLDGHRDGFGLGTGPMTSRAMAESCSVHGVGSTTRLPSWQTTLVPGLM